MSNYIPVTSDQGKQVSKIANDKKIGRARFQQALDDGGFGRFLEGLKEETPEINSNELVAPEGARLHTLRIRYRQNRPWGEAVDAAGHDTPSHYNVRKVGSLYSATGTEEVEEDLILLNYFYGSGSWDKALAWGSEKKLEKTVPREVFAVGEHYPTLHTTLGLNPMWLVATTPCTFGGDQRACCVWWDGTRRSAFLDWTSCFNGRYGWFLFRKSSVLKTKVL